MPDPGKLSPQQIFEAVTDRILELLDQGTIPWRQPWRAGWPCNLMSGRPYSFYNALFLNLAGFGSPYWATALQVERHGGRFRDGQEKKPASVFVTVPPRKYFVRAGEFGRLPRFGGMVKVHSIWNVEQTEGLERLIPVPTQTVPVEEAQRLLAKNPKPPLMRKNPKGAFYHPGHDCLSIQSPSQYRCIEEYYCTLFHELIHSTGHECRLKRKSFEDWSPFDLADYSFEELVAELGAAMLCGLTGLAPLTVENSAGYIQGWLKAFKDDKSFYFRAAAHAQKAANYLRGEFGPAPQEPGGQPADPRASVAELEVPMRCLSAEKQLELRRKLDRTIRMFLGEKNLPPVTEPVSSRTTPDEMDMELVAEVLDVAEPDGGHSHEPPEQDSH